MDSPKFNHYTKTTHTPEPDYTRPVFELPKQSREIILKRMQFLYGDDIAEMYLPELERILQIYMAHKTVQMIEEEQAFSHLDRFTEEDIILITYGDLLKGKEKSSLTTLAKFCDSYLGGTINTIHILPFFPYSSDRGFSIVDFETVDPHLGTWEDIHDLEGRYQLMFDGVINHVSSKSRWFQEFLNGHPYYKDFFITYKSYDELSDEDKKIIFRPRTSDILTKFYTLEGIRYVWTTFSEDQIDLNYKNPNVLLRVLDILLLYVRHGADIIRLDAVTYLWTEPGTRCVNLEQTHEIVKLFRDILNAVAPHVAMITETNVPHNENISYFGNGHDEAQMVYNFALPPMVLHTFYSQDATALSLWATSLEPPSKATTFFNFLDSHDGIGLMGVRGILSEENITMMTRRAEEHGAFISYKTAEDGSEVPYELNVTWFSALNKEDDPDEDLAFQVKRFVASRSVALVIKGVPGIYLHSLIGTPNDIMAVLASKSKRDINRTVLDYNAIAEALNDPLSKISRINRELGRILKIRTQERAFHPNGSQNVLMLKQEVFSVLRRSPEKGQSIITLTNISNRVSHLEIKLEDIGSTTERWFDLISEMEWYAEEGSLYVTLNPYDICWLKSIETKP